MNAKLKCNVCQGSDFRIRAELTSEKDNRDYTVYHCNSCGLLFVFPLPENSFDSLQDIYDEQYIEDQRQLTGQNVKTPLDEAMNRQIDLVEQFISKGTVLNVGAAGIACQVFIERGSRLKVVDVSEYAAKTARDLWGLDVTASKIEDYDAPAGAFDFIKLGHIIEHLANPRLVIERLAEMMHMGGIILIDTDNARGLSSRLEIFIRRSLGEKVTTGLLRLLRRDGPAGGSQKKRHRYGRLIPPEHLYLFSEQNLRLLLENAGFEVVKVMKPAWGDTTWFPLSDKSMFSLPQRILIGIDRHIGARLGAGEVLAVFARKQ